MGRSHAYKGTAIGREMEQAINTINRWQQVAVAVMTRYEYDIDQTIAMLFTDDDIAKSEATKDVIVAPYGYPAVPVADATLADATLALNFAPSRCHPITPKRSRLHPTRSLPLTAYISQVNAIYRQYEQVKAVLRWLNTNATLNAIRYYFPAAATMCPQTFAGLEPSARHATPEGINEWLQPIRDAAATVASAVMLPGDAQPRTRETMWLTFPSAAVQQTDGALLYKTDQTVFNI